MGSKKEEAAGSQCLKTLQKVSFFHPLVDSFKFFVRIFKEQKRIIKWRKWDNLGIFKHSAALL